jgi:RNA polymerase sigma-70 factor (ECF subfamily)
VDRRRFGELYEAHAQKLYNYALWLTRNTDASQDIVQTVFVKVWRQKRVPERDREIEAWLHTITRNACLDFFRKHSRFSRFRIRYAREKPRYTLGNAGERFVWELLASLQEIERTILYMHLRSGYTYGEIAEALDMTEGNVRVKAFRALAKLRKNATVETA